MTKNGEPQPPARQDPSPIDDRERLERCLEWATDLERRYERDVQHLHRAHEHVADKLSHGVRLHLRVIASYLELALYRHADLSEGARESIETAKAAVTRANDDVDELLGVMRLFIAPIGPMSRQSLRTMIEEIVVSSSQGETNLELICEADDAFELACDWALVKRAFTMLVAAICQTIFPRRPPQLRLARREGRQGEDTIAVIFSGDIDTTRSARLQMDRLIAYRAFVWIVEKSSGSTSCSLGQQELEIEISLPADRQT